MDLTKLWILVTDLHPSFLGIAAPLLVQKQLNALLDIFIASTPTAMSNVPSHQSCENAPLKISSLHLP
ncbi:hypothetical protein AOLI_G00155820 [Acnodon oligacanthus]